jgi:hypothetical protein
MLSAAGAVRLGRLDAGQGSCGSLPVVISMKISREQGHHLDYQNTAG